MSATTVASPPAAADPCRGRRRRARPPSLLKRRPSRSVEGACPFVKTFAVGRGRSADGAGCSAAGQQRLLATNLEHQSPVQRPVRGPGSGAGRRSSCACRVRREGPQEPIFEGGRRSGYSRRRCSRRPKSAITSSRGPGPRPTVVLRQLIRVRVQKSHQPFNYPLVFANVVNAKIIDVAAQMPQGNAMTRPPAFA